MNKKKNEITLIEIGITNLDILTQVENEKTKKYDLIANELALSYKCKVKIIPFMMTWDGVVTKYHKKKKNTDLFILEAQQPSNSLKELYLDSITLTGS